MSAQRENWQLFACGEECELFEQYTRADTGQLEIMCLCGSINHTLAEYKDYDDNCKRWIYVTLYRLPPGLYVAKYALPNYVLFVQFQVDERGIHILHHGKIKYGDPLPKWVGHFHRDPDDY